MGKKKKKHKYRISKKVKMILMGQVLALVVIALLTIELISYSITVDRYMVKFDTLGGSEVKTQKVIVDNTAKKPKTPTKEGYTFDNWYVGDNAYDFKTKVTSDMTIYARWTPNGPVYTGPGLTLEVTEIGLKVGKSEQLIVNVPIEIEEGIVWYSSDDSVATVSELGQVQAVGVGTATITVATSSMSTKAECVVTVSG